MAVGSKSRVWVVVALAGLLAIGLNWFVSVRLSPEEYQAQALTQDVATAVDLNAATPAVFAEPEPPGPAAATAIEAVEGFAEAEIAGDFAGSYGLLAEDDRNEYLSPATWQLRHSDLPELLSVANMTVGSDGRVTSDATFRPVLDRRMGAVASTAQVTWSTVAEDGGFRVVFTDTLIEPQFPDPDAAVAVASAWAEATQSCEDTSDVELEGGLLGIIGFVGQLCGASGEITVGSPAPLSSLENPGPVLNGLGPAAADYSQVVALTGPVPMRIVLAPFAESWAVVGLDQP